MVYSTRTCRRVLIFGVLACLTLVLEVTASAQDAPYLSTDKLTSPGKPPLSPTSSGALFDAALRNYNNGKFWEARTILEDLLALTPDHWLAHALYWDAVERTADFSAKREAIRVSLIKLLAVPDERRTEDFYAVMVRAFTVLSDRKQVADYTAAAIAKFPRGELAKKKMLADVRQEPATDKAIAAYDALVKDFEPDQAFSFQIASDKFDRLARNRTFYDAEAMTKAAAEFDAIAKGYAAKSGNNGIYLSILRWIAETLSYTAPAESIRYAQAGADLYQTIPAGARGASRNVYLQLWPAMLRSANALEQWPTARNAGAMLVREVESGSGVPSELDEAAARKDYATALEKLKLFDQARAQLAAAIVAAKNRAPYQTELKAFNTRHPLTQIEQVRFDKLLASKLTATDSVRDDQLKADLLKSQIKRPGAPFHLTDVNGRSVDFNDYRGRVLVLGFWATWCGPCIREMEEMKVAYANHANDPDVAFAIINVDADKADIPRKAKESGYNFPILLSDGKIEGAYGTDRIPKLIIIDGAGNIRFDRTGYTNDGTYLKKLDWMIEAAKK
jgi:thiol-disulfide isomerase/thioredoxin